MAASGKKTRGKQHIEIKKIEKEHDRMVTFSKRKAGIYKKASELNTLTGAKVGVLVFSPSGTPYSLGLPSMDAISNRFLGINPPVTYTNHPYVEAQRQVRINELNQLYNESADQVEAEKDHGKLLKERLKGKGNSQGGWWDAPIEELNPDDLQNMDAAFEDLSRILCNKIHEKTSSTLNNVGGVSSSSVLPPDPLNPDHQPDFNQFLSNPEEVYPSPRPYGDDGLNEP